MARGDEERPFGNRIELLFQCVIFYSLMTYFVELEFAGSENSVAGSKFFLWSERVVASIFSVEYVLRWIRSRRWLYPLTLVAIIDLLAVLPFYIGFLVDLRALRLIRTLRALRLFKLHRYNKALNNFTASLQKSGDQLAALGVVVLFFVMLSSSVLFECEHLAQPHVFAKLSDAIWWCVTTLTTVGYGDKFPVTTAGRITATFTVLFGLGVFGTFISVIGGAFLASYGGSTSIRISHSCRERLVHVLTEQGKDVNASTLSYAVESIVEQAVVQKGA